jgi:spermidine/putrescine transport system substrate-binding protein
MLKNDMLLPIDRNYGNLPDYTENLSHFLKNRMDAFSVPGKTANDYMLPYMWGTSGILYNPAFISKEEVSSWACFFDPRNKGKILMKDHYWDAYNMAAIWGFHEEIATGKRTLYDVSNDHTDEDLAMVEKQLKLLQPNLAGWEADFGKEMMTKGQAWMNYAWSGDAVWAIEEAAAVNVTLDYIIPQEGSNIWFDGWVIPKNAGNPKAASYFLNFISMPENALRNMDITGYTSALATPEILEAQIDSSLTETINLNDFFGPGNDSLKVDPIQYPDSAMVERCVLLHDFMDKNDEVLEMWSRAKGDSLNNRMIYIIVIVVAALLIGTVYSRFRKKTKKRK